MDVEPARGHAHLLLRRGWGQEKKLSSEADEAWMIMFFRKDSHVGTIRLAISEGNS